MNRRDIIKRIAIGGTTFLLLPYVLSSCDDDPMTGITGPGSGWTGGSGTGDSSFQIDLSVSGNAQLNNPNGFIIVNNTIIVNMGAESFIALSSLCTHQSCTISFNPSTGNFPCPCHESVFADDGSVIRGPASRPLNVYKVTKTDNILTVTK